MKVRRTAERAIQTYSVWLSSDKRFKKLLKSFNTLIEHGHSIFCIEHNLDVIKNADWIIDLGPEGGAKGGKLIFEGQPYDLIKNKKSYTGKYLKSKLS